ncbi:DUF4231 domain-containing protein [Plesiomonas sp.]|uniref:DUF4231 domain-containing protein n=1 Tax=Plesiomonas sp. TaxID=2486279 RepID=UPI003F401AD3
MGIKFPDVYNITNKRSILAQKRFLRMVKIEYLILIFTAINSAIPYAGKHIIGLCLLIFLLAVFFVKRFYNFEKKWYKYRALTESIKTITWRFAMRAEPFISCSDLNDAKQFHNYIESVISGADYALKTKCVSNERDGEDAINDLRFIRNKDYECRRDFYVVNRIVDQRDWYAAKSVFNKNKAKKWAVCTVCFYIILIAISGWNALNPEKVCIIPVDILTTVVASVIGWNQTKKYQELSASYQLTAHEIGLIKERALYVSSDDDFVNFVRDAETAFSREHTQWLARRAAS